MQTENKMKDYIKSGVNSAQRKIDKNDPIQPGIGNAFTKEKGSHSVNFPGLTIEQYFMAAAKPPKAIFETTISKHTSIDGKLGVFKLPEADTIEADAFLFELAEVDANYRMHFARQCINLINQFKDFNDIE